MTPPGPEMPCPSPDRTTPPRASRLRARARRRGALGLAFFLALGGLPAGAAPTDPPLRMVTSVPISSKGDSIASRAIATVMQHAGLPYTLNVEPRDRALLSFKNGMYDVDILRSRHFDELFPKAIRVEPHLLTTTVHAFTRESTPPPTSWHQLKGHRVVMLRGARVIDQALPEEAERQFTSAAQSCLAMVAVERADVCLLNAELYYRPPQGRESSRLLRSVIGRAPLYVWVAPGRQALAKQLGAAIRAAVASGELAQVAGEDREP